MAGTDGNDNLIGTDENDILSGGLGNDVLDGRGGADRLEGGPGDDVFHVDNPGDVIVELLGEGYDTVLAHVNYALGTGVHVEVLAAYDQFGIEPLVLTGNEFANTIIGNAGGNLLVGGGWDSLVGLGGDDSYLVESTDTVAESAGAGYDAIYVLGNHYSLGFESHVELLTAHDQSSTGSLVLIGNKYSNTILGNAGENLLVGGGGGDILVGFDGNDDYLVTGFGDQAAENANQGYDSVYTLGSFTLGYLSHIEVLTAHDQSGTAALALNGNQYGNLIIGNAGANFIAGGGGADILVGLEGNDDYLVTGQNEQVAEAAGGGYDSIYTQGSYTLGYYAQVELLTAHNQSGTQALTLIGNQYGNNIIGNAGANFIVGGGGSDALVGLGGNDDYLVESQTETVTEQAGGGFDTVYTVGSYALAAGSAVEVLVAHNQAGTAALNLTGSQFANNIYGNAGANRIDGGGGTDLMAGFGGDDFYIVDNIYDTVIEDAGRGFDIVAASVSYTLAAGAHVEVLTALDQNSFADMDLTGNSFANTIFGNNGYNFLDGGGGADTLIGMDGDDDYLVDSMDDVVVEAAGKGEDWVFVSGPAYTLGAGVSVELLIAADVEAVTALSLTGNELNQVLAGNMGANVLNGGGGADFMVGFAGDDTYFVDNEFDEIFEDANEGTDRIFASVSYELTSDTHVETLAAVAGTSEIDLVGNGLANTIIGNAGSNILVGNGGIDILTGGTGADFFGFISTLGPQNLATITDFNVADDVIILAGGGNGPFAAIAAGTLSSTAFVSGISGALDADDRIIYNPQTGALSYDADGSGGIASVQFATLSAGLALTQADFTIIPAQATTPVISEQAGVNDTIGTAQTIARSAFQVAANANLSNAALPSVTIEGALSTVNDRDYYAITLTAGERITLDIDFSTNEMDTIVRIYNSTGFQVAFNDDGSFDTGSSSDLDSFLSYTATTAGTYYFSVESYDAGTSDPYAGQYDLNVSVAAAGTASAMWAFPEAPPVFA